MKKKYLTPITNPVDLHGELMIRSESGSGAYTPLNPTVGGASGAPVRVAKMYI